MVQRDDKPKVDKPNTPQLNSTDFVTKEELRQIVTGFEENMEEFDTRTKDNTDKLEEVEKKVAEIPTVLNQIQSRLTTLFKYLTTTETSPESPESKVQGHTWLPVTQGIIIIMLILVSLYLYLYL